MAAQFSTGGVVKAVVVGVAIFGGFVWLMVRGSTQSDTAVAEAGNQAQTKLETQAPSIPPPAQPSAATRNQKPPLDEAQRQALLRQTAREVREYADTRNTTVEALADSAGGTKDDLVVTTALMIDSNPGISHVKAIEEALGMIANTNRLAGRPKSR